MTRLVGYDLTGWRDLCARNWLEEAGEETLQDREVIVSGGAGGVVVQVGDGTGRMEFMGGLQALRAPHGRGPGWGVVGDSSRRLRVTEILKRPKKYREQIIAAIAAMADPRGATAVLSIPDTSAFEKEQEDFLACLGHLRASRRLLVWRPVLACLAAHQKDLLQRSEHIAFVGHDEKGLISQRLRMREDRGILAPERREIGRSHDWGAGLEHLMLRAKHSLAEVSEAPHQMDHLEWALGLVPLGLGDDQHSEPVRRNNGSWEIINPPELPPPVIPPVPPRLIEHLEGCDVVLFVSPTSGRVREAILAALTSALRIEVIALEGEDVARGGLIAAERLAAGRPVYFDFLPQISTVVQGTDGARNYDLIPLEDVLPAGRAYRSKEPARFGLVPGMDRVKIYLRKQSVDQCRLAVVSLPITVNQAEEVALHVEQTPAAGRARLTLSSDIFPNSLTVDWDDAEPLDESWEEIIESQEPSLPSVPNRVVLPCGMDVWDGIHGAVGLGEILLQAVSSARYDWDQLARQLMRRPLRRYAISSNGELPSELENEAVATLKTVTRAAEDHVRERLAGKVTADNSSLRFLTWQFQRCPSWVVKPLIKALGARTGRHVFVQHFANRQLVYQALGRITKEPADQRKIFGHLVRLPSNQWKRDQLACAGFLLSRNDAPVAFLERTGIEKLGKVVILKNKEAVGSGYNSDFFYAPYLMVGLLRCRLSDPWTLVAGRDALADQMLVSTESVINDMKRRRFHRDARISRYREVLAECCDHLRGRGRNPDILIELEDVASERARSG